MQTSSWKKNDTESSVGSYDSIRPIYVAGGLPGLLALIFFGWLLLPFRPEISVSRTVEGRGLGSSPKILFPMLSSCRGTENQISMGKRHHQREIAILTGAGNYNTI